MATQHPTDDALIPRRLIDPEAEGMPIYFCPGCVPEGEETTAEFDRRENVVAPVCEVCARVFPSYASDEPYLDLPGIESDMRGEELEPQDDGTYTQVAFLGEWAELYPSGTLYPPGASNVSPAERKLDELFGELLTRELATIGAYFIVDEEGGLWAMRDVAAPEKGGKVLTLTKRR
jgi:hypothetical protein